MKKLIAVIMILTLSFSTLTACGGNNTTTGSNSGDGYQAQQDKILRMTQSSVPIIDPAVGSDSSSSIAHANLYDTLVYPDLNGDMQPMVAESWETSDDGLSWIFHLRDDVKFHDGTDLKASDVVFSMNRLVTMGEGYAFLFASHVEFIEATDDYTVEIKLKDAFAPFLTTLCRLYIVNEDLVMDNLQDGSYGDFGDYGKAFLTDNDAGSGAYQVKELKKQDRLVATAFEDYWGEINENAPETIELIGVTQTATVRTWMTNGELEISDSWQTEEAYQALDNLPDVDVCNLYIGSLLYGSFNTTKAPMDDIHVRKAIAYMMDYDLIVSEIYPGSKKNASVVPEGLPGYTDEVTKYEYNLEKAKEELAQSKYADNIGDYEIDVSWIVETPDEEKIALLIQSQGEELGLNVKVEKIPWLTQIDNAANAETTPCISLNFVAPDYNEAGAQLFTRFHSSMKGSWQATEWLDDKELDQMIEDALVTMNQEERFEKYAEIQKYISEQCYCLTFFNQADKHAYYNYLGWSAAKAASEDAPVSQIMGYNYLFKDFSM